MVDVSIGIVSYNSADVIRPLLDSIFRYTKGVTFKVSVVDNGSQDGTAELVEKEYPQVTVIRSENNGFGAGHNHLLDTDSRYHLICNPDIRLKDDALTELVSYMDSHPECAVSTPMILNPDGSEQKLPKHHPSYKYMILGRLSYFIKGFKKYRDEYTMKDHVFTGPEKIETCTGCFMLMRTEVWKKTGGFDTQFFMYMEDADLSNRASQYGDIVFCPGSAVVHDWHQGSSRNLKLLSYHLRSMVRYMHKTGKAKRS